MIGEGYGYMKELAETMREVQVALVTAKMSGDSQIGDIPSNEQNLIISFR